jgi:hypothetical protein
MDGEKHPRYNKKHGFFGTKVYQVWAAMKNRCLCKSNKDYEKYGGRGITVDADWLSFENFYRDMGDSPDGHSLDRIDNSKGYSKNNCRWANSQTQQNNRRTTILLTYKGATKSLSEWAEEKGILYGTMLTRHYRGWSPERTIEHGGI